MTIRNDRDIHYDTTVDGVDYSVKYSVWIWKSPDSLEQDEEDVEIQSTEPCIDDDSETYKTILDELIELEL